MNIPQWYAICPKCESFYLLSKYQNNYFCAHVRKLDLKIDMLDNDMIPSNNNDEIDKIECKLRLIDERTKINKLMKPPTNE